MKKKIKAVLLLGYYLHSQLQPRIYLIGEAAPLIAKSFVGHKIEQCDTLNKALHRAINNAKKGDTILFSPACASFDQYLNFEERGKHFISLVKEYRKNIN